MYRLILMLLMAASLFAVETAAASGLPDWAFSGLVILGSISGSLMALKGVLFLLPPNISVPLGAVIGVAETLDKISKKLFGDIKGAAETRSGLSTKKD